MKPSLCICALLPRVETKARVVVVMHALEHKKSTNTGRLLLRCLPNSELVWVGNPRRVLDEAPIPKPPGVVLFPVAGAQPMEDFRGVADLTVVALDANWRQAARMRKRYAEANLPFAHAPAGPTTYELRKGPHAHGMSTFEAVARSLAVLEDVDVAPLLRALTIFQDRLLWLRGTKTRDAVTGGIPDGVERHSA